MSNDEVGAYIKLLCYQWSNGSIPKEKDRLFRVVGGEVSEYVMAKFDLCPDGELRQHRLEKERAKQIAFRQKQSEFGKKGGRPKKGSLSKPFLIEKGSQSPPSPSPSPISDPDSKIPVLAHFERFWTAYPRKVGKKKALSAFVRHKCSTFIERILSAIEAQKGGWDWQKDGGQFIPYPERWLNGGHWDNSVSTPPVNGKPNSDDRAIKDMERLLRDQDHLQL